MCILDLRVSRDVFSDWLWWEYILDGDTSENHSESVCLKCYGDLCNKTVQYD